MSGRFFFDFFLELNYLFYLFFFFFLQGLTFWGTDMLAFLYFLGKCFRISGMMLRKTHISLPRKIPGGFTKPMGYQARFS